MPHTQQIIQDAIEGYFPRKGALREPQTWHGFNGVWSCHIESKGKPHVCVVDEPDLEVIGNFRWYLKDGYAITSINGKKVKMHWLVTGKPKDGYEVDHINGDKLNNQRANLKIVTGKENRQNKTSAKGIRQRGNKWTAQIYVDGKHKHLGTFDTATEARNAYLKAKEKHYGIRTH